VGTAAAAAVAGDAERVAAMVEVKAGVSGMVAGSAVGSEAAAANESDRGRQGKDTFLLVCRNQKR
jgi:hypothetical protein